MDFADLDFEGKPKPRAPERMLRLVVVLADGALSRFDQVEAAAAQAGFRTENAMPALGLITGVAPESAREAISKVEGVDAVEDELPMGIDG